MKQVRNINLYGWGLGLLLALAACSDEETNLAPQEGNAIMTFRLSTRAGEEGAASTEQHTYLYVAERLSEHSGIDENNPMGGTEIPLYCDKDFTIEGNSYSVTNLLGQWYKFAFVCVPFADMLNHVTGNDFNTYYIDYKPVLDYQTEHCKEVANMDLSVYRKVIDRWAIANSILTEDVELTRVTGQLVLDMGKPADQFETVEYIRLTLSNTPNQFYIHDEAKDSVILVQGEQNDVVLKWDISEEEFEANNPQIITLNLLPCTLNNEGSSKAEVLVKYKTGSEAATYTLQNDNGEPIVIKKNTRTIVRFNGLHPNEFEVRYAGFADGNDAVVGVDDDKWNGNQLNKGDN